MGFIERFASPGNLQDVADPAQWSQHVATEMFAPFADHARFFDPTDPEVTGEAQTHRVTWAAFPGELTQAGPLDMQRAEQADQRAAQDEYCEWAVQRDEAGKVIAVTFTTETWDYFDYLRTNEPEKFAGLYQQLGGQAPGDDLVAPDGTFNRSNQANSAEGQIVHLSEFSNALGAAVKLAGDATVLWLRNGQPVTDRVALVECGNLGVAARNSDPQIADAINGLVRDGRSISLADPAGLYLDSFSPAGLATPDGTDPTGFWQPLGRGDDSHVMRARFSVPDELDYEVGDITLDGAPIRFGSQLAQRVRVRIQAISLPSDQPPDQEPCPG